MKRLVIALMLAMGVAAAARAEDVDLHLVLAMDVSRSIDEDEFQLQRRGYSDAFRNPAVIRAIQSGPHGRIAVAFIEWAGSDAQRLVIPWTVISDEESGALIAERLIAEPRSFVGWTSISGAITFALEVFRNSPHQSQRRTIDVSGDGVNNSGRPANRARDEAVQAGITINGLVIMNDRPNGGFGMGPGYGFSNQFQPPLDEFYREQVIGGPGAFVVAIDDFSTFAYAIVNKLIREVSSIPPSTQIAEDREGLRVLAANRSEARAD